MKYRTIVADPPWEYTDGFALGPGHGVFRTHDGPLPYQSMTVEQICALPVTHLADVDCRLFLWTTNRYLFDGFRVMRAWGFRYRQTLVWHKTDANLPASVAPNSAEFILVGVRGAPERLKPLPSAVIPMTRRGGTHEGRLDFDHRPGEVKLFNLAHPRCSRERLLAEVAKCDVRCVRCHARRHGIERGGLNGHVWGNESANTATLEPSA